MLLVPVNQLLKYFCRNFEIDPRHTRRNPTSGVYYYQLVAGDYREVKKRMCVCRQFTTGNKY